MNDNELRQWVNGAARNYWRLEKVADRIISLLDENKALRAELQATHPIVRLKEKACALCSARWGLITDLQAENATLRADLEIADRDMREAIERAVRAEEQCAIYLTSSVDWARNAQSQGQIQVLNDGEL